MTDVFAADVAAEIANQAAGRIKAKLAQSEVHVGIGLPQVVLGVGHKTFHRISGPILHIDFSAKDLVTGVDFGITTSPRRAS